MILASSHVNRYYVESEFGLTHFDEAFASFLAYYANILPQHVSFFRNVHGPFHWNRLVGLYELLKLMLQSSALLLHHIHTIGDDCVCVHAQSLVVEWSPLGGLRLQSFFDAHFILRHLVVLAVLQRGRIPRLPRHIGVHNTSVFGAICRSAARDHYVSVN